MKMVEKINDLVHKSRVQLDFEDGIIPLSKAAEGGSISERHLVYGLSLNLIV